LDYQADTVTNFTTLVDEQARGINSVYLITSDYHMRPELLEKLFWQSRGIEFKSVSVPSARSPEPLKKRSVMEAEHCFG